MRTLYLDAFSGISGDMMIGVLLDLGVKIEDLKAELQKLHLTGYSLSAQKKPKNAIYGTDFDVVLDHGSKDTGFVEHHHDHHHGGARHLTEILTIIKNSDLSEKIKRQASGIFTEIGKAESQVHQVPLNEVHFHEVGALDSIVDIVGSCIALDLLHVDHIKCSTISDGSGFINVAHGQMPVPVPAVMQMWVGTSIPIKQRTDVHTELITPTGMGIIKVLVDSFGTISETEAVEKVGYGFGKRDTGGFNALRAMILDRSASRRTIATTQDQVAVLKANLDNQTGESLGYAAKRLFEAGALDVFLTPIQMKKGRPGQLLTVIASANQVTKFTQLILKNTATKGVRYQIVKRTIMQRKEIVLPTDYGDVHLKIAQFNGMVKATPEYDDVAHFAMQSGETFDYIQTRLQALIDTKISQTDL